MSTSASELLADNLLMLDSEFRELEEEYRGDIQQQSILEDPESPLSEVESGYDDTESAQTEASCTDLLEASKVQEFLSDTCKCRLGVGNIPCSLSISVDDIQQCRQSCSELTHNELDLVIMSQVHYYRTSIGKNDVGRPISNYYFHGVKICQATFLFLHGISRNRYLRVTKLYESDGLTVSKHGNTGKLPKHTCTFQQVQEIRTFIENYSSAHGLPIPGRLPNTKDKVLLLPSDISKMFVFRKYQEASANPVRKSKFLDVWSQLTPYVAVMKPASDLCFTCQQNNLSIAKAAPMPEAIRRNRYEKASQHLEMAREARHYYRKQCEEAETTWKVYLEIPGESVKTMHYSYDFAQQVHFPFDSQQTGPAYFKTARKCGIFGVCCEGKSEQVNYLIDEAENPGKGADCTISLVHHYLEKYGCCEDNVRFHADNCTGQNKNNANVQYLLWRVLTGRHLTAELSFMLVGHTKFAPDRFFGLVKKRFRRSCVDTIEHLAQVVRESTLSQKNKPQVIRDLEGCKLVTFYQWSTFLQQFFKTVPNILRYHRFYANSEKPGIITVRKSTTSEDSDINILKVDKQEIFDAGMPHVTIIKGLDAQRQWYLFEQIRPFCKCTLFADLTCPKPSCPKPTGKDSGPTVPTVQTTSSSASTLAQPTASNPRKRKCSVCNKVGHTKRTCKDITKS